MVFGLFSKSDDDKRQQASDNLVVTSVVKRPNAIILVFGHMGAEVGQMSKYAELYHDMKCSTICATAPIMSLASNDIAAIGEYAISACREAARLIRMAEMSEMGFGRVPVVVHVLGNGGAQVLEELEKRINEVVPKAEMREMIFGLKPLPRGSLKPGTNHLLTTNSRSGRSLMDLRSSSTQSLLKSKSMRNLMSDPLSKSAHTPSTNFKESTRSLLTSTSLSETEDEDGPEKSEDRANDAIVNSDPEEQQPKRRFESVPIHAKLKEKSRSLLDVHSEYSRSDPTNRIKGLSAAPACVMGPRRLFVPQCESESQLAVLTPPPRSINLFPPGLSPSASNPLHRRIQRRRRRKRTTPTVKRVDMERSGLTFSETPRYNPEDRAYQRDIELFASHLALGSIVFDSSPYFPSIDNEMAAIDVLLANQNPAVKLLAQSAIVGSHGWHGLTQFNYLGYVPTEENDGLFEFGKPGAFWRNMMDLCLSKRHAFIFSQADKVCQCDQIKRLIKTHQKKGIETSEIELVATRHLQHRKRRVDMYTEFIEGVLNSLDGGRIRENEDVSDWFTSDEEDESETASDTEKVGQKFSVVEALSQGNSKADIQVPAEVAS